MEILNIEAPTQVQETSACSSKLTTIKTPSKTPYLILWSHWWTSLDSLSYLGKILHCRSLLLLRNGHNPCYYEQDVYCLQESMFFCLDLLTDYLFLWSILLCTAFTEVLLSLCARNFMFVSPHNSYVKILIWWYLEVWPLEGK